MAGESPNIHSFAALAESLGRRVPLGRRPVVAVQGLGFVGAAMAVATAHATDGADRPAFDVLGVELPTPRGKAHAAALNRGELPFTVQDPKLHRALERTHRQGNLLAVTDPAALSLADTVLVDVSLDLLPDGIDWQPFRAAIRTLGEYLPAGALVVIETTVPPGTCDKVVAPLLDSALAARGLAPGSILLAHAYERVMPGEGYWDSLVNYWRVYAGHTPEAAERCAALLSQIVNVAEFPLTRLASTTASETAKLLENSYRAVNIAFVEEWSQFAEAAGVDLFEVIDAIRRRPSHANLRWPGFGVGGYCLPKDPMLTPHAVRELWDLDLAFPFSEQAVATNRRMPLRVLERLNDLLGCLAGRRLLLLGITYRPGVGDTRGSPAAEFLAAARQREAEVTVHDPLVDRWPEVGEPVATELPDAAGFDAILFTVAHPAYRRLDLLAWLGEAKPIVFDAGDVLTEEQRRSLVAAGRCLVSTGRGNPSCSAS